jgi:hypothetical protein
MRDLKDELTKVTTQREQLEKDMKELSDLKQKLRKDLRVQKGELSDAGKFDCGKPV